MDDPDESVKLTTKAIRIETRRGQGAVDGEAGLGLEEHCERVECGKSLRGRRIGGRTMRVRRLCASRLRGGLQTEGLVAIPVGRDGRGREAREGSGEGLALKPLECTPRGCQQSRAAS